MRKTRSTAVSNRLWQLVRRFFVSYDNKSLSQKLFRLKLGRLNEFELCPAQTTLRVADGLNVIFPGSCRPANRNANLSEFSLKNVVFGVCYVEFLWIIVKNILMQKILGMVLTTYKLWQLTYFSED